MATASKLTATEDRVMGTSSSGGGGAEGGGGANAVHVAGSHKMHVPGASAMIQELSVQAIDPGEGYTNGVCAMA